MRVLRKYNRLFSGELGKYPHAKIHLEVEPGATPIHARPFSVPRVHYETFKKELQHLVEIGVLRPIGRTEWASPTFIIPKKDNRVRWISDFRELNKVLKRRIYPLPFINDVLTKRPGYEFFTKLDISMCYYTFELDEPSQELCTINTLFGKFAYNRLAMGLAPAPDFCQEIMEQLLRDIEECDVFIDDVGVFSNSWEAHLNVLNKILKRLEDNGFTVNPTKCEWAVKETDWLGYWLTPTGLKPWKKKVAGILAMQRPKTLKQLRSFIGAVNYYRDLWPRRSHVLQPLTELTGNSIFEWKEKHDKAFETMKSILTMDVQNAYPDHNLPFEIYTDASDYQLGACIMQNGRPVAYFSRKLTPAQQNYSTMEKELLSIVMTLNEYRSMLYGAKLTIFTDHKNLTYANLNSQRVLRWRLFLEEFGAKYTYIEGKENVLADTFSRLPSKNIVVDHPKNAKYKDQADNFFSIIDDDDLLETYLNLPAPNVKNPLNMKYIHENQAVDARLNQRRQQHPDQYPIKTIDNLPIICYRETITAPQNNWKICIPTTLIEELIEWFHLLLGHAGATKLYHSIRPMFYHPHLKRVIDNFKCDVCQRHKLQGPGYGLLPPRTARFAPWEEVHIDLVGPWPVKVGDKELMFQALTCIDPVTNLVDIIRVDNKYPAHVQQKFQNCWLSRYPWPKRCVHDQGGEFTGWEFQQLLEQCNIISRPITALNPQSNSICERMHQTMGNILRTLLHGHPINNAQDANDIVDNALATTMHALRAGVSRTLNYNSPGALAFRRDMFLNIPLEADLHALHQRRQLLIDENLRKTNAKRREHNYNIGDYAFIVPKKGQRKLNPKTTGPFKITELFTNGTVRIQRTPVVSERINIRRLVPHFPNQE